MALLIRIDVDRPYGRSPLARHILSRVSSDFYFPRLAAFGFLHELQTMLNWLNEAGARAHVFFRRCTLPSPSVIESLRKGGHEIGLHLENSRSFNSFREEIEILERHVASKVRAVSKHGSGGAKFGFHHYAPYEPEKYGEWARQMSLELFLGNLEDPTLEPVKLGDHLWFFPSAFWLEPHWRDIGRFTVDWLLELAWQRDVVLLVHPENVLADPMLASEFKRIIRTVESRVMA